MAIEEANYEVIRKTNSFEIRDYAPHIVAETVVAGNLEEAGSVAFKILFGYISGDNRSRQDVEMTAPVSQQVNREKINMTSPVGQQSIGDKWVVSFTMPASYTMETVPVPENPKVRLRQVPGRRMAVVRPLRLSITNWPGISRRVPMSGALELRIQSRFSLINES